jgi:radical SAM superfamily enzyme
MVIQRLTGDCPRDLLVAPKWTLDKQRVLGGITEELKRRDSWQGKRAKWQGGKGEEGKGAKGQGGKE